MATDKQKEAARRNIAKARQAQSARPHGKEVPRRSEGMSTADKDRVDDQGFAFPEQRKEPLTDAKHVRNAIARFDQVEGVSDGERDRAWERILSAARRFDVEVSESGWRDLAKSGKDRKRSLSREAGHARDSCGAELPGSAPRQQTHARPGGAHFPGQGGAEGGEDRSCDGPDERQTGRGFLQVAVDVGADRGHPAGPEAVDLVLLVAHYGQEGVVDDREGRQAENRYDQADRHPRDDRRATSG
jgi:hypothetical protein